MDIDTMTDKEESREEVVVVVDEILSLDFTPRFILAGRGRSHENDDNDDNDDSDGRHRDHPACQLETFLEEWSSNPSFDFFRPNTLIMPEDVVITRSLISRLLPLLHCDGESSSLPIHDNDDDHMDHSPPNTSGGNNITPVLKFSSVQIDSFCRFFSPSDVKTADDDGEVCTSDDKLSFLSALGRLPLVVAIDSQWNNVPWFFLDEQEASSPQMLLALLSFFEIQNVQGDSLSISLSTPLSDLQYTRLGAMIQGSVQLKELYLQLPFSETEVPQAFFDSLADSIHIQILCLRHCGSLSNANQITGVLLSKLFVGEDGNGAVERLLQNPQSQLRELDLSYTDLEDDHLVAIAKLLPNSHVKTISFENTCIKPQGLLEFARQLPKMQSLSGLCFLSHSWQKFGEEAIGKCGAALLDGFRENPHLIWMDCKESFPQRTMICHYISLNRAGRKILTSTSPEQPIPDGLWPHILARAGRRDADDGGPCLIPIWDEETGDLLYNGPANAVYFFLQNYPKLFSYL